MKKIAILLATYNGAQFLSAQLLSIEKQSHENWCLYVLEDGSSDKTLDILKAYQEKWGASKLVIFLQPNQGATRSFLTLICNQTIHADYYAYCDQDDIWGLTKLERAIDVLKKQQCDIPLLYCSRAELIDTKNKPIGCATIYTKTPCFEHALVQNIASGNTMVFNNATRHLLAMIGVVDVPVHDWWTYILVTACGGKVFYDPVSSIKYRQHARNLIGYHRPRTELSWNKIFRRIQNFYHLYKKHATYLKRFSHISLSANKTLEAFENSTKSNVILRLYWLYQSKVFRKTAYETLELYLATILHGLLERFNRHNDAQ